MRCSPDTFLKVRIPNEFENLYSLSLVFAKTHGVGVAPNFHAFHWALFLF